MMKLLMISICLMLVGCLPMFNEIELKKNETYDFSTIITYFDQDNNILYINKNEIQDKRYLTIPIGTKFFIIDEVLWTSRKALFRGYSYRSIVTTTLTFHYELNGEQYETDKMEMTEVESLMWRSVFPNLYHNIK